MCRKKNNEAVDIHMPAASKNVNFKSNNMKTTKILRLTTMNYFISTSLILFLVLSAFS